mgnify:CR=1 FL=1
MKDVQLSLMTLEEVFLIATRSSAGALGATVGVITPPRFRSPVRDAPPVHESSTPQHTPHTHAHTPHAPACAPPPAGTNATTHGALSPPTAACSTAHSTIDVAAKRHRNDLQSSCRRCASRWHGATTLACLPRVRHLRTVLVLLVAPALLVTLMFLLQMVVTHRVQQFAGATHQAYTLHPTVDRSPLVTAADDFDADLDCPATQRDPTPDYGSGEWLYAVEAGASGQMVSSPALDVYSPRWYAGEYGAPVAASASDAWEAMSAARSAPSPQGLLGNFTRDVTRMGGVKAKVYVERGNEVVVCDRRPYVMPLSFKHVGDTKVALEDALFQDFGHTRCVGCWHGCVVFR